MDHGHVIGVDIGTTSTKSVVFRDDGAIVASRAVEYPLFTPTPGAAEQDPDEIHTAVLTALRASVEAAGVGADTVRGVAFSAAMHSLIALDASGTPLTRCLTWADNRSQRWAERIRSEGGAALYRRTGTPLHPMSPLTKIRWLREERPQVFARAAHFVSIKEYVCRRLFGEFVVDHSIAAATGLLHLERLDWDEEALHLAGITRERLARLVPTTYRLGGLGSEIAERLGLHPDTPFIVGASDGVLSNLGVGAIEPGVAAITIGTSGAIRSSLERPLTDPQGRLFCYPLTGQHWIVGGPVNNGGLVLRWVRDELGAPEVETARRLGVDAYELLGRIAERAAPGSEGVIFHPYLAGERAPLWDPNARGSFFGLGLHHRKEHLVRAAFEGVLYNLCAVSHLLEDLTGAPHTLKASGGFIRSETWVKMLADVFDRDVEVPASPESACLGAAVLGLYALGRIPSLHAVANMVGVAARYSPTSEHARVYARVFPLYERLSESFAAHYPALAQLQQELAQRGGDRSRGS